MIKRINLFPTLLLLMAILGVNAQERHDWDKIKSLKIAFITERLELTATEAQNFWPIYNDYETKKLEFHKMERSDIGGKIKNLETLSEAEASTLLNQLIKLEEEKQKAEKAYIEKVAKIISPKKTIRLIRSEDDFKRRLIKQFRERKEK